nr:MAG TPA: hypothetical protein [Caudoviricetes sp.]
MTARNNARCHKVFTFQSPKLQKIRRYKTVLVVYLV